ncbi:MAG: hypothetical protein EXR75_13425 [Myxococcales bacterium]|nr:hypothetical protein [Myxococcales bacterium]
MRLLDTPEANGFPAVAGAGGGDFVIFYTVFINPCELRGQKFTMNMLKSGPSFLVSTGSGACAGATRATANAAGDVMVVWATDPGPDQIEPVRVRAAIYPALVSPKP